MGKKMTLKKAKAEDFSKNLQYYKFCAYGFLKNLRFYEPFLMLFFLEKGLNFFHIGTLYAVREICVNIIEIPSGVIADSLGRRRSMAVSFISYIISFIIFFGASTYWVLFMAMMVYAVGEAFRTGTHKAMIFDYLKQHGWGHLKTHYYGHTRAWSQAGAALSALIAAFLVFWRGSYAPVFLFTIIPYVLDLILIMSYPKHLDGPRHTSNLHIKDEFAKVFRSLLKSISNRNLIRAIANQSLYSGYYKAFKDYLQPILKQMAIVLPIMLALHEDQRTALITGSIYAVLYLITAYASKASGGYSKRFDNLATPLNRLLFIGIGFGVVSAVAYLLEVPLIAIILYVGIYVIENLRKPMGIAYVTERMDETSLASALSVESQAETLVAVLMAFLLGLFINLLGLALGLLVVSAISFVFAILLRLPEKVKAH
ncbi:MAG: MFS transporter [Sphaerochaetaceae bacterium]|jgi:MFS family permease|nr:MFS transporter [Sphaerochaetaceae bacterium]MDD2406511.1 MFS transporter [Sphaerochaetaceae bacterium]MDD3670900.1 MFS transporter [Sphaerochaetaceae bacterium]MDD4259032.1 MFS transporter [Sphaerochaetaceae bacterium]MDD4762672.1 MFS transporter [Sphaerochaetaceae bacterium]